MLEPTDEERDTEFILLRWAEGKITEGQAARELGVNRLTARTLADEYGVDVGSASANRPDSGHDAPSF